MFSILFFNVAAMNVTGVLSGIHRVMMNATRTMILWIFGLVVFYGFDSKLPFGESWTPYSWLQLIGFVIMVLGQCIYGAILKVPGMSYPEISEEKIFENPKEENEQSSATA